MLNKSMLHKTAFILLAIFFLIPFSAVAQKITLKGKVTDQTSKEPLIGATILVKGSGTGTSTAADGTYTLSVTSGDILLFSYIGYKDQEQKVGNRSILNVSLSENAEMLNDIVVIGYGTTTKKEITGSVASIKKESLNQGTFTNAMGLLQGKVAGLQIVNPNGGDPNASYEILLRGTNTLSAGQGPLIIIDGVAGADIRNINFQDVESVDVLKDGSAAAIYGTRGTNGVVIITTKRARAGVTQVDYNGQLTVGVVARRAKPLSAGEYKDVINTFRPELSDYINKGETDWFDEITRTPVSHKHSLAVSGGKENFSHRTVINYENNQGLQLKNDASKILLKSNIRQSILEGWMDLDCNLSVAHREYSPSSTSAFMQAFTHNPTEPVYDPTNVEAGGYSRTSAMAYYNPVAMINEQDYSKQTDSYGGNVRASLNVLPVPGLKWDNFLSLNRESYESRSYYSRYYPSLIGANGQASIENYSETDSQFESTLNYSKQFGKHSIQTVLGYTYQYSYNTTASMINSDFDLDDYKTHNMGAGANLKSGTAGMYSFKEDNTYIAFFGRAMYNYDNKYLLAASLRRDGSSRFGANNKWGWFPALSAGWRISEEQFMKDLHWFDDLKLRVGYGVTGNQDFSNYKSLMMMSVAGHFYYNGDWINTYQPASNANPNLAWEKKSEFNVGLDFTILNKKLNGSIDYYKRKTSDLLYDYTVPTPPYVYNTLFTNVGQVTNEGIELTLNATPVKTQNFKWDATLTVSHNSNKLDKFTNKEFSNGTYKVGWSTSAAAYTQRLIEGQSLGTFYAPIWLGTDLDGTDVLLGQNDKGSVNEEDWKKVGCAYPDATIGWSNTFSYKQFDLNFALRASIGGEILNNYAMEYENFSSIGLRNISSEWLNHKNFTSTTYKYSSKYIEDASYLKLDNITLGYNLDLKSKFIKKMRLALSAQNLFCITGYSGVDPEVALSGLEPGLESLSYYPRVSEFTFNVNISF